MEATEQITEEIPVEPTEEIQEEPQEEPQEDQEEPQEKVEEKPKDEYTERVKQDMIKLRKRAQKAERELARRIEQEGQDKEPERPSITNFKNEYDEIDYAAYDQAIESYEKRLIDHKFEEKAAEEAKSNVEADQQENVARFARQIDELSKEHPDIKEVIAKDIYGKELQDAIMESDQSGKLALYLGKNENEAIRLSELGFENERQMIKELGKLEERITGLAKNVSNAPPPITPVDDSTGIPEIDESKLSDDEWYKREEKKRWEALKKQYE